MPDLDLGPNNYRERGRRRVIRSSRGHRLVAVALAIWAGAFLVFNEQLLPGLPRVWAYVVGIGPFAVFWLWFALFDP